MQSKILILLFLSLVYLPLAQAEEISVVDAETTWNLTLNDAAEVGRLVGEPAVMVVKYADVIAYDPLEDATDVGRLVGEPGVMVVKYADTFSYKSLEDASNVGRLVGEPAVMVVKYADVIAYDPLEDATDVGRLVGEPGVMVVKYADAIGYSPLEDSDSVQKRSLELTIDFPHNGDLILNSSINVSGTAVSLNEITQVTVNGVPATGTTSWSAEIPLSTGANTITVEAVTNTSYSRTESTEVFHYTEGNYIDVDGDGVIDVWDFENNTTQGYLVNSQGIGFLFGDFNNNGMLDSGDVTILMQRILELLP